MQLRLHPDEIDLDQSLVQQLVNQYLPELSHQSLRRFHSNGTDNWLFRLGDQFALRLPRRPSAAVSLARENEYLNQIREDLPQPIPTIKFFGQPDTIFSWPWALIEWIEGDVVPRGARDDRDQLATDLGEFVCALGKQAPLDGPVAGGEKRGGSLLSRDALTRKSAYSVADLIDIDAVLAVWDRDSSAGAATTTSAWFHGDLWGGNVLQKGGRLCGVIDFGSFGVGDPAVDLVPAWSMFKGQSRHSFCVACGCESETWQRGRAWALSIALVQLPYYRQSDPALTNGALGVIAEILADHK